MLYVGEFPYPSPKIRSRRPPSYFGRGKMVQSRGDAILWGPQGKEGQGTGGHQSSQSEWRGRTSSRRSSSPSTSLPSLLGIWYLVAWGMVNYYVLGNWQKCTWQFQYHNYILDDPCKSLQVWMIFSQLLANWVQTPVLHLCQVLVTRKTVHCQRVFTAGSRQITANVRFSEKFWQFVPSKTVQTPQVRWFHSIVRHQSQCELDEWFTLLEGIMVLAMLSLNQI